MGLDRPPEPSWTRSSRAFEKAMELFPIHRYHDSMHPVESFIKGLLVYLFKKVMEAQQAVVWITESVLC